MFRRVILFLLSNVIFISSSTYATDLIRYHVTPKMLDEKQSYFLDALKLALNESRHLYGDYKLEPVYMTMTQERRASMLEKNEIVDVVWRMTSDDLESRLQTIYFPLMRGLMGARIFLIKKDHEPSFNTTTTLASLQKLSIGQGSGWPDTDILEFNGFDVTKADTKHLISMLEKERFDYYPRALHEPWLEMVGHNSLMVEKNLMFYYPSPVYFFVHKNNKKLYQRINDGLFLAQASGRYEKFFNEHPVSLNVLKKTNINHRKTFILKNPLLSKQTQQLYKNKELWIKLPFPLYKEEKNKTR